MSNGLAPTSHVTEQVDALLDEAYEIRNRDTKRSVQLCDEAFLLSEESGYSKGKAAALSHKGYCNVQLADYATAIHQLNSALAIFQESNDQPGIGTAKYNLGLAFLRMGDFNTALEYEMQALSIRVGENDIVGMANCHMQIGYIYEHFNDLDIAMSNYVKCLDLHQEAGNEPGIGSALMGIGSVYVNRNDHENVKKYLDECVAIRVKMNDPRGYGAVMHRYTTYYFQNNNFSEAHRTVQLGMEKAVQTMDKMGLTRLTILLGKIHAAEKDFPKAIETLHAALKIAQDIKLRSIEFEIHEALSSAYESIHDFENALAHHRLFHDAKEEVLNTEVAAKVRNIETIRQMESANQEAEIHRLKNVELKKAYGVIEEKNKDITDSINYAKRIQQAKLPEKCTIAESLPHSFVLFKPKDIVSGDFYFFLRKNNSVFIAAADCTGHGVPGALMSMIGSEKLTEALALHNDPSEILRAVNIGIKKSLRQKEDEESTRDGMDIVLCRIDLDTLAVHFAGANRPLWMIRNGSCSLEEIKATKKALGGHTGDDQHFDKHTVMTQPGDTLYLLTDGYGDLFNGADGKKLTTKRLKELLLTMQDMPMNEQEVLLEDFAEKWKAGTEQIDDILVIGVRLS